MHIRDSLGNTPDRKVGDNGVPRPMAAETWRSLAYFADIIPGMAAYLKEREPADECLPTEAEQGIIGEITKDSSDQTA